MSLISNKQQELISKVVENYVKNYDKIAQQYLKIRQEILELSVRIRESSPDSKERILLEAKNKKLAYDLDNIEQIYRIHLNGMIKSLDADEQLPLLHLQELNITYDKLLREKTSLKEEITKLRDEQKPLLDKVQGLLKNFDQNMSSRSAKKANKFLNISNLPAYDENNTQLDFHELILTRDHLKQIFDDIEKRIIAAKHQDEDHGSITQADVPKMLEERVSNVRSVRRIDDDKYFYDISRSALIEGLTMLLLEEYNKMIENLVMNINDLIEHGTQSKERWTLNVKKLDAIKEVLKEFEDETEI